MQPKLNRRNRTPCQFNGRSLVSFSRVFIQLFAANLYECIFFYYTATPYFSIKSTITEGWVLAKRLSHCYENTEWNLEQLYPLSKASESHGVFLSTVCWSWATMWEIFFSFQRKLLVTANKEKKQKTLQTKNSIATKKNLNPFQSLAHGNRGGYILLLLSVIILSVIFPRFLGLLLSEGGIQTKDPCCIF